MLEKIGVALLLLFLICSIIFISLLYWSYRQKQFYRKNPSEALKAQKREKLRNKKVDEFFYSYSKIINIILGILIIYIIFKLYSLTGHRSYIQRPWQTFNADVNHDGTITTTGVVGWLKWLLYLQYNWLSCVLDLLFPHLSKYIVPQMYYFDNLDYAFGMIVLVIYAWNSFRKK